jgi:5-methylcytosine-specific restriction endonuclease McrA
MSGYKFSAAQRFAVYTVHGGTCYLNKEPLYLTTMRIDHVLPRSLKGDPERLSMVLKEYGLPDDFKLDSFENWLPTCDPCNSLKYKDPFRLTPIIQRHIDRARAKAGEAKALADRIVTNQAISTAVNTLQRARDQRQLDLAVLEPLIALHEEYHGRAGTKEFRVTPQFTVLHEREGYRIVRTEYGVGFVPSSRSVDDSFLCPNCGNYGPWSGARCLSCGQLIEDA